jgi:hypothetical protein
MEPDPLKSELDQVTAELAAAKIQHTSLGAQIAGLEARKAALSRAIPRTEERSLGSIDIPARYRTEDIVEILVATGAEMSINDVVAALHEAGRPRETYDNVGADLAYLADAKRIARVRRGVYAAIHEPQADPERIVIPLTQGNINNHHVYLSRHLDFFPADAIGAKNKQDGQGKFLTLQFEDIPGVAETDIAPDHKIFRLRDRRWREFFTRHGLQAGDKIAIERIKPYEYRIVALPRRED